MAHEAYRTEVAQATHTPVWLAASSVGVLASFGMLLWARSRERIARPHPSPPTPQYTLPQPSSAPVTPHGQGPVGTPALRPSGSPEAAPSGVEALQEAGLSKPSWGASIKPLAATCYRKAVMPLFQAAYPVLMFLKPLMKTACYCAIFGATIYGILLYTCKAVSEALYYLLIDFLGEASSYIGTRQCGQVQGQIVCAYTIAQTAPPTLQT